MDLSAIVIKVKANLTEFNDSMNSLKGKVGVTTGAVGALWTAGVTTPIVKSAQEIVKTSSTFQTAMSQVQAITNATSDDMARLEQAAQEMGRTTKFSASESADAMSYMALAGWDTNQIISALPTVLDLAAAGGLDLAYASDLVTDSMSALGLETKDLDGFVDQLAVTSQKSNTSVAQLGEGILTVGGTAKNMAGGVTEMNTVLGILADNGIKGAEGGTALRNVILSLSAPTDKAALQMEALGLKVFDAEGNMRPLNETFQDLDGILSTMNQGEQIEVLNTIFNKVDLKSVNALLANSGERFNELSGYISEADGAAGKMAATMSDNLEGKTKAMESAIEGLQIKFGEVLLPVIEKVVDWLTQLIGKFTEYLEQNPWLAEAIAALATGLAVVGPLLLAVAGGFALVALLSSPLTLTILAVAAGIAALIAGVILLVNNWDWLVQKFNEGAEWFGNWCQGIADWFMKLPGWFAETWNEIVADVAANWETIKGNFAQAWEDIKGSVSRAWEAIKTTFSTAWESIKTTVSTAASNVYNTIKGKFDEVKTNIETTWNNIKTSINTAWENIKTTIKNAIQSVKDTIWGKIQEIKTNITDTFNGIFNTVTEIWEKIKNIFKNPIKAVVDFVTGGDSRAIEAAKGQGYSMNRMAGEAAMLGEGVAAIDNFDLGLNARAGNFGASAVKQFNTIANATIKAGSNKGNELLGRIVELLENPTDPNYQIIMDTGVLVGEIAPGVNQSFADQSEYRGRGR